MKDYCMIETAFDNKEELNKYVFSYQEHMIKPYVGYIIL